MICEILWPSIRSRQILRNFMSNLQREKWEYMVLLQPLEQNTSLQSFFSNFDIFFFQIRSCNLYHFYRKNYYLIANNIYEFCTNNCHNHNHICFLYMIFKNCVHLFKKKKKKTSNKFNFLLEFTLDWMQFWYYIYALYAFPIEIWGMVILNKIAMLPPNLMSNSHQIYFQNT